MIPPSTQISKADWDYWIHQSQENARNELACLHRDPITGEIHTKHASSTGLYRMPPLFMGGV